MRRGPAIPNTFILLGKSIQPGLRSSASAFLAAEWRNSRTSRIFRLRPRAGLDSRLTERHWASGACVTRKFIISRAHSVNHEGPERGSRKLAGLVTSPLSPKFLGLGNE